MDLDKIELYTTVYRFSKFILNIPSIKGGFEVTEATLIGLTVTKQFESHYAPFLSVTLEIPQYVFREMQRGHDKLSATILWEYGFAKDLDKESNIGWKTYFSGELRILMDDTTPDIMSPYKEEYEKEDGGKKDGMGLNDSTVVSFLLFNKNYYEGGMKLVYGVLNGPSITDVMVYCLNKGNINRVLMSPASGSGKVPTECRFHAKPVQEELQYMADTYHLHKKGTMVFFDIDKCYIIEKAPTCTAWTTNEITKTYIVSMNNYNADNAMLHGCFTSYPEKYNLVNIPVGSIDIENESISNEHVTGNNLLVLDTSTGSVSKVSGGTTNVNGVTGIRTIDSGSKDTEVMLGRLQELKNVIHLRTEGTHLEFLNPNKEFIIAMDDSKYAKYNGSYRITTSHTTFRKDGKNFIPITTFTIVGGK